MLSFFACWELMLIRKSFLHGKYLVIYVLKTLVGLNKYQNLVFYIITSTKKGLSCRNDDMSGYVIQLIGDSYSVFTVMMYA